eukprot:s1283_g17.t1
MSLKQRQKGSRDKKETGVAPGRHNPRNKEYAGSLKHSEDANVTVLDGGHGRQCRWLQAGSRCCHSQLCASAQDSSAPKSTGGQLLQKCGMERLAISSLPGSCGIGDLAEKAGSQTCRFSHQREELHTLATTCRSGVEVCLFDLHERQYVNRGEQKFFQAKSLKLVFPIVYPLELVGRFVHATETGPAPAVRDQEAVEIIPEDFARLPDNVQPPRHWIDAHERTEGCSSCSNRSGRHSKKCVERYQAWLRAQRNQAGQSDQPDRQLAPPAEEPNREEDL